MTATDELRRMLDERGVVWRRGFGDDTLWTGRHGIEWRLDKQEGSLAMCSHTIAITPIQAIETTLGRGTCSAIRFDNLNESNGMGDAWEECSECGALLAVITDNQLTPNYCPNCGRKVVDK